MQKMQKKQKLVIVSILLFLSGCSSMNSKFDCPNKPGVTCRSLDQVNDMVDRGIIGRNVSASSIRTPVFYPNYYSSKNTSLSSSLRSGESVMRIWVAAYQDVHNNYHNESTLYTVVRKNNWTVPKEVKE